MFTSWGLFFFLERSVHKIGNLGFLKDQKITPFLLFLQITPHHYCKIFIRKDYQSDYGNLFSGKITLKLKVVHDYCHNDDFKTSSGKAFCLFQYIFKFWQSCSYYCEKIIMRVFYGRFHIVYTFLKFKAPIFHILALFYE